MTLAEAVVSEAAQLAQQSSTDVLRTTFLRGLARNGFVQISVASSGQRASIRTARPATDDEVHHLLKSFGFATPPGHRDHAIEAHTFGNWAACNGQLRAFMVRLFDDSARHAAQLHTAENRHAMLATERFLDMRSGKWSGDGKNFDDGVFKMLHCQCAYSGTFDDDHSAFRMHAVLVTPVMHQRRLTKPRPHP